MILIDSLYINQTFDAILAEVSTEVGAHFTKVLVWNSATYKDPALAIDVSSLLLSTSNTESLTITANDLGVTNITGLWFIEFTTDEVFLETDCCDDNSRIGIVTNFIKYHECILNRILNIDIKGCNSIDLDGCTDCNHDFLYTSTLLEALDKSLWYGFYEDAIRIINILDELCEVCTACPDLGNTLLKNNGGFGTFKNILRLV